MGSDKAAVLLAGESLLARMVRRLAPECARVVVSTRAFGPGSALGLPVVTDLDPGGGPLQAMLSLLEQCPHGVLVVPVDMPFVPESMPSQLSGVAATAACVGYSVNAVVQPLPVLLKPAALNPLRQLVSLGERRAGAWRQIAGASVVDFRAVNPLLDPEIGLAGVNDPEALQRAERRIAEQG